MHLPRNIPAVVEAIAGALFDEGVTAAISSRTSLGRAVLAALAALRAAAPQ